MEYDTFEELESGINLIINDICKSVGDDLEIELKDTIKSDIYNRYKPIRYVRTDETYYTAKHQTNENEIDIYFDENEIETIDEHTHSLFLGNVSVEDFLNAIKGEYNHGDVVSDFKKYVNKNIDNMFAEKLKGYN